MGMLKEMDIFVRSHLTPLKDEQVSLMRARWERDKRKQNSRARAAKRRRTAKAVEPPPAPPVAEGRPMRRRRTAAEVAAPMPPPLKSRRPSRGGRDRALALETAAREQEEERPAASLEERAAALFKDLAPAETPSRQRPQRASRLLLHWPPLRRRLFRRLRRLTTAPRIHPDARPAAPSRTRTPSGPGEARRCRRVPSHPPHQARRRSTTAGGKRQKRKKGKKSLVDQEAVAQNISRTLATLKAPVGKKGVHRREEGPTFREVQEERRREEREREKTLVRVTEFITVSELANTLKVPPTQIVTFAFKELGQMVTINQRLDFDMIELIASASASRRSRKRNTPPPRPKKRRTPMRR